VQISDLQTLLGLGIDGLTLSPADDQSVKPILESALGQGIAVASWATDLTASSGLAYYGFEGSSHYEKGEAIITAVLDCLKAKGQSEGTLIEVGQGAGTSIQAAHEQAINDVLALPENSGYTFGYRQFTNETREDAIRVFQDALTSVPNPAGVFAAAPEVGQGVIQVLKSRGYQPGDVCLATGGGWDAASGPAIKDGWYYRMAVQQAPITGQQAIRKLVAILNGQQVPFQQEEPLAIVTAEMVDGLDLEVLVAPEGYSPVSQVP
jgi:ribose transport system substrate-binding protein